MSKEDSASATRYEQYVARLARENFYRHPESEAERIAVHYVSHAMIAFQLAEAVSMRRQFLYGSKPDLDAMILMLTKQIKTNHLHDFGIKLEWHPNAERET